MLKYIPYALFSVGGVGIRILNPIAIKFYVISTHYRSFTCFIEKNEYRVLLTSTLEGVCVRIVLHARVTTHKIYPNYKICLEGRKEGRKKNEQTKEKNIYQSMVTYLYSINFIACAAEALCCREWRTARAVALGTVFGSATFINKKWKSTLAAMV